MDWWLPVSHTTTAITDTAVKTELEQEAARVKILGPDSVQVTEMLDDKIAFLEEARSLNLPVPDYYQISSCQDVVNLCRQGKIPNTIIFVSIHSDFYIGIFCGRHFFLKPLNPYSEDRVCFDRIPDNEAELKSFLQNYQSKISANSPYFVSEFVQVLFCFSKLASIYYANNHNSIARFAFISKHERCNLLQHLQDCKILGK